jgi:hypothetical protein
MLIAPESRRQTILAIAAAALGEPFPRTLSQVRESQSLSALKVNTTVCKSPVAWWDLG